MYSGRGEGDGEGGRERKKKGERGRKRRDMIYVICNLKPESIRKRMLSENQYI
jgi:hypothetical protein